MTIKKKGPARGTPQARNGGDATRERHGAEHDRAIGKVGGHNGRRSPAEP